MPQLIGNVLYTPCIFDLATQQSTNSYTSLDLGSLIPCTDIKTNEASVDLISCFA